MYLARDTIHSDQAERPQDQQPKTDQNRKEVNKMTMTKVNASTQKGQAIIYDHQHARYTDIYQAYGKPSTRKVRSFYEIKDRAVNTPGYNHDLRISGAGSHFYSTVYSFTQEGKTHIVKDTASNVYMVTLDD